MISASQHFRQWQAIVSVAHVAVKTSNDAAVKASNDAAVKASNDAAAETSNDAAVKTSNDVTAETSSDEDAGEWKDKTETVYVDANADGSVKKITVKDCCAGMVTVRSSIFPI